MNEQIQLLRRQLRMVWPYRWAALGLAAAICGSGWLYVLSLPNIYRVDAKIFVDTRSMLRPLLQGLAIDNNSLASSASLMKRTLLTRPNLEDVARKTDLDLTAKSDAEFDAVVTGLAESIKLNGTSQDNIYEIAFEDADREKAKRIVDELLNGFLETALGSNRKDTAVTQKFLEEQIDEYEKRLLEAEQRLKEFKQRNVGLMPGEGDSYFADLQAAKDQLKSAQLELDEARGRAGILRSQLEGDEPVIGIMGDDMAIDDTLTSQYDGRIARLEESLDQLTMQYTDKHPDVAGIREQLAELEARREKELKKLTAERSGVQVNGAISAGESPVYQEIKLAMAQAEAEVAGLQARVQAYTNEVEQLEKSVDTIPEIEAELKRLDRDYGLNKQQYDELLKRREAARLSQQVDQQADDIKLKVIEPPRIPLVPIGPNRIQFLSMVLIASLGAAAGLAFLLAQLNPRFYSSDELKEIVKLPIIGTISLVYSHRQRTERRMELAVFSVMLLVLISAYGGLVTLEMMQFDLNGRLASLLEKTT